MSVSNTNESPLFAHQGRLHIRRRLICNVWSQSVRQWNPFFPCLKKKWQTRKMLRNKYTELSLGFWKQESQSPLCQKLGVPQYKRILTPSKNTSPSTKNGSSELQIVSLWEPWYISSDFIWQFLRPYMGVIPNPKKAFIFPISSILALIFPILIKYFPKCVGKGSFPKSQIKSLISMKPDWS